MKNGKILFYFLLLFSSQSDADTWNQRAGLTGLPRDMAVSFSIGNNGYIGMGYNSGAMTYYKDFWEFNPDSNTWTQKADFGGGFRALAFSFSIGTKGYAGTGWDYTGRHDDFWEWNQLTNTWSQKTTFPGITRQNAVSFSIGSKGYVVTGGINGSMPALTKEMWEWDGDTSSSTYNTWTPKTDFGGAARMGACGFSIGTKGYVGTGSINLTTTGATKDFWMWEQSTNAWAQIADCGTMEREIGRAHV